MALVGLACRRVTLLPGTNGNAAFVTRYARHAIAPSLYCPKGFPWRQAAIRGIPCVASLSPRQTTWNR
jgi:hypothetical protein